MIPNHPQFIEAIAERKKVKAKYYSKADSGVIERICAPIDYGPGAGPSDGLNRYWLWDYAAPAGARTLGLSPQEIVEVRVLGEEFPPGDIEAEPWPWGIPRPWGRQVQTAASQ